MRVPTSQLRAAVGNDAAHAPSSRPLLRRLETAAHAGANASPPSPCIPSPTMLSSPNRTSSSPYRQIPVTKDFCENPGDYAPARLDSIERFRSTTMWGHEFVIVHGTGTLQGAREFWIRVDRGASLAGRLSKLLTLFSLNVDASDVIQISHRKGELEEPPGTCERLARIELHANDEVIPTVRHLAEVVREVVSTVPRYNISKHNCRFMASVIQQAFMDNFSGVLDGSPPTWHKKHGCHSASAILRKISDSLAFWGSCG